MSPRDRAAASDSVRSLVRAADIEVIPLKGVDQKWGDIPPGTTVALKNGWLPLGAGWAVNSIGWVDGSERDYLIAVLTSGSPNEAYGIASISMVGAAAWAALGPSS